MRPDLTIHVSNAAYEVERLERALARRRRLHLPFAKLEQKLGAAQLTLARLEAKLAEREERLAEELGRLSDEALEIKLRSVQQRFLSGREQHSLLLAGLGSFEADERLDADDRRRREHAALRAEQQRRHSLQSAL